MALMLCVVLYTGFVCIINGCYSVMRFHISTPIPKKLGIYIINDCNKDKCLMYFFLFTVHGAAPAESEAVHL